MATRPFITSGGGTFVGPPLSSPQTRSFVTSGGGTFVGPPIYSSPVVSSEDSHPHGLGAFVGQALHQVGQAFTSLPAVAGQLYHDPVGLVEDSAKGFAHTAGEYGPFFRGYYDLITGDISGYKRERQAFNENAYHDPLGILSMLTLVTPAAGARIGASFALESGAGRSAIARAALLGRDVRETPSYISVQMGGRAARDAGATLGEPIAVRRLSANHYRANREILVDRVLNYLPEDFPMLGVGPRAAKATRRAGRTPYLSLVTAPEYITYKKAEGVMTRREKAAAGLRNRVPITADLPTYIDHLAAVDQESARLMMRQITDPKIWHLYQNPTKKMIAFNAAGHALEPLRQQVLIKTGALQINPIVDPYISHRWQLRGEDGLPNGAAMVPTEDLLRLAHVDESTLDPSAVERLSETITHRGFDQPVRLHINETGEISVVEGQDALSAAAHAKVPVVPVVSNLGDTTEVLSRLGFDARPLYEMGSQEAIMSPWRHTRLLRGAKLLTKSLAYKQRRAWDALIRRHETEKGRLVRDASGYKQGDLDALNREADKAYQEFTRTGGVTARTLAGESELRARVYEHVGEKNAPQGLPSPTDIVAERDASRAAYEEALHERDAANRGEISTNALADLGLPPPERWTGMEQAMAEAVQRKMIDELRAEEQQRVSLLARAINGRLSPHEFDQLGIRLRTRGREPGAEPRGVAEVVNRTYAAQNAARRAHAAGPDAGAEALRREAVPEWRPSGELKIKDMMRNDLRVALRNAQDAEYGRLRSNGMAAEKALVHARRHAAMLVPKVFLKYGIKSEDDLNKFWDSFERELKKAKDVRRRTGVVLQPELVERAKLGRRSFVPRQALSGRSQRAVNQISKELADLRKQIEDLRGFSAYERQAKPNAGEIQGKIRTLWQKRLERAAVRYDRAVRAEDVLARSVERSLALAERQAQIPGEISRLRELRIANMRAARERMHDLVEMQMDLEALKVEMEGMQGQLFGGGSARDLAREVERQGEGQNLQPFYMPDEMITGRSGRRMATAEGSPLPQRLRADIYGSKQILFRTGMLALHPDTLGPAYFRAAKHDLNTTMHQTAMKLAARIDKGQALPAGYEFLRRTRGETIPQTQQHLGEHLRGVEHEYGLEREEEFSTTDSTDQRTIHTDADGKQYRLIVPRSYMNEFRAEKVRSDSAVKRIFSDSMDVWRSLILHLRVPWLVNNVIGNTFLYAMKYGGARSLAEFVRFAAANPVTRKYIPQMERFALQHLTAEEVRQIFPEQVRGTHFETQTPQISHILSRAIPQGVREMTDEGLARVATRGVAGIPRALPRLDKAYERKLRAMATNHILRGSDEVKAAYKTIKKQGGTPTFKDAVDKAIADDPGFRDHVVREVNDGLGDFLSLSRVERGWIRNTIPFYAWMREITRLAGRLAIDNPGRVLLLHQLAQVSQELQAQDVPDYLKGLIPFGAPSGGLQSAISTHGMSPYATVSDLGKGAQALFGGGNAYNLNELAGNFHPLISATYDVATHANQQPSGLLGYPRKVLEETLRSIPQVQIVWPYESNAYPGRTTLDRTLRVLGDPRVRYDPEELSYQNYVGR